GWAPIPVGLRRVWPEGQAPHCVLPGREAERVPGEVEPPGPDHVRQRARAMADGGSASDSWTRGASTARRLDQAEQGERGIQGRGSSPGRRAATADHEGDPGEG